MIHTLPYIQIALEIVKGENSPLRQWYDYLW